MRYTKREVKLVDMFALVLAAIGMLSLLGGIAAPRPVYVGPKRQAPKAGGRVMPVKAAEGVSAKVEKAALPGGGKATAEAAFPVHPLAWRGVCLLALAVALHLGVRRVIRNKLEDVDDLGEAKRPQAPPGA